MIFKVVFYSIIFISSYLILVLINLAVAAQFLMWALLGLFTAFIGLNIAHDAVHGSLSSNKSVNKVLGYTFNIVGANSYMWNIMHNIVHHTYTNIEGHDEGIELISLLRMSPHQKLKKVHRYQYWYAFFFTAYLLCYRCLLKITLSSSRKKSVIIIIKNIPGFNTLFFFFQRLFTILSFL
ncbi:MAG: fatty acid desaturase family protein [Chitinophagaceae bacterium]